MAQIAITISVSLLASWLVAVSLIPMLSARMRTPPAVHSVGPTASWATTRSGATAAVGSTRTQRDQLYADLFAFVLWRAGAPAFQPKVSV